MLRTQSDAGLQSINRLDKVPTERRKRPVVDSFPIAPLRPASLA
jgi:hypothetical protein